MLCSHKVAQIDDAGVTRNLRPAEYDYGASVHVHRNAAGACVINFTDINRK